MSILDDEIFDDDSFKLVVAIVQRGYSEEVIYSAKSAGAEGGVVLNGKGSGSSEKKFFGMKITPENEVVLIIVKEKDVVMVMKAIYHATDYQSSARGMVFCLPISYVTGMTHIREEEEQERLIDEKIKELKEEKLQNSTKKKKIRNKKNSE